MTPDGAIAATTTRLLSAGLVQVRSPLGSKGAGSQRIHRGFAVLPQSLSPSVAPDRGRPSTAGIRVTQVLTIQLTHQVKAGAGLDAPVVALGDLHDAWRALYVAGTSLTAGVDVQVGTASTTYEGGGAFVQTSFGLSLTYNLDLTP